MKPQDINNIAQMVVNSLGAGSNAELLGCGAISSRTQYNADPQEECETLYECGGLASFYCCEGFTCWDVFDIPDGAASGCLNDVAFLCPGSFSCDGVNVFSGTAQICNPT